MVPDQRTLMLIGSLVVGTTLTSVLLLALEPGRRAPLSGIELTSIDPEPQVDPTDRLFDTEQPLGWRSIIIHDTGTQTGSARAINRAHERLGRGGLGYHFVINNGSEKEDGLIEVGFRWSKQLLGAYLRGPGADQWHRDSIGVVLIGDADNRQLTDAQFRELVWLVRQLQRRFDIPAREVYVDLGESQGPARFFPHVRFQQQLLDARR
jgi:hypothetical protein